MLELTEPGNRLGDLEGKRTEKGQGLVFLFGRVVSVESHIFL